MKSRMGPDMRYLDRAAVPAPPCLAAYNHGVQIWQNLADADRGQIHDHLEQMQGRRCAYCEGSIDELGQHIEHFRRRHDYPALTFSWGNLFRSCNQKNSCGHFKDNGAGAYNPDDLIDPCLDDPDQFFLFRADGTISVREGLAANEQHRAIETLRVFSLNPQWGRLRNMRQAAVAGYIQAVDEAASAGFTPDEIRAYFADCLEYTKDYPFYTAIRHVLTER